MSDYALLAGVTVAGKQGANRKTDRLWLQSGFWASVGFAVLYSGFLSLTTLIPVAICLSLSILPLRLLSPAK
ncbi:hypothetical protein [uncultured Tateyamaria sp.]|uniref:hypothetical protein n=1 Tax=uncultured Tateyamaria sp. TaxID=455651 RepID=UPI00260A1C0F|nr:hypothetical protein [uncultured Tateyamaria sp.]